MATRRNNAAQSTIALITGAAKKTQENPGIFPNPLTNPRVTGENFLASTKKPSHLKRFRGPQLAAVVSHGAGSVFFGSPEQSAMDLGHVFLQETPWARP